MYALTLLLALAAQRPDSLAANVREYVTVDTSLLALTHVLLIDGTGAAPKEHQTVVIRNGKIAAVGPVGSVQIPAGAKVMDLSGSTVIPGLIGMHDHLFYTAAGGRAVQMGYTGPRLYLGSGVTTIRTTGSRSPYAEINLKDAIDHGFVPGPRIHITAPYITGAQGGGAMAIVATPEAARRFVAYWGAEGATWIKAYTDIRRSELSAAIQEAHKHGMKVTGHLCSVSFQEAVGLGIDNLEHGMLTASDFDGSKKQDACPMTLMTSLGSADPNGSVAQQTIRTMVQKGVSMTSTLAVYEPFVANRPTKDERTLNAMDPEVRAAYLKQRQQIDSSGTGYVPLNAFKSAMAFDRAFVAAGGTLARRRRSDGDRRSAGGVRRPAQLRAVHRGGVHARAGGADHVGQRRQDPRRRADAGDRGARQAGRSRGAAGRSHRDPCRDSQPDDCLQGRCRVRRGEADRVGAGEGWR